MEENSCKGIDQRRVNLQNIQTAHATLCQQKTKKPKQKIGGRSKEAFLQRKHTDAQKHMKKCLLSLIIRDMKIKTTVRYHLTLIRMANIKNLQTVNPRKSVVKREPSYTVARNVNLCSHYEEKYGGSLKK